MKISVNWLKEYIPVNHTVEEMADKVSLTGIESGPVKLGEELTNLVVGHITSVTPHPDSDHLKVCQVDVGEDADIQIVWVLPMWLKVNMWLLCMVHIYLRHQISVAN